MYKIIIVFILLFFIILFYYVEPIFNKSKIKKNNEYGSARFSTLKEIKKNFPCENINNIKKVGFPIYYSKNLKHIFFDRETPHYVYLGSTGSGKSVTAVIPTCTFIANSKEKRSVFITDSKGEIYHTTSQMFKDNGYKILTIDLRNPEKSDKINLLEPIIAEYEKYIKYEKEYLKINDDLDKKILMENKSISSLAETNRMISSISDMIMQEKIEQKDPFWNNSAKNLLEGIIAFFLEEYKLGNINRNQITMTSIRKFQNSSMENKNFRIFKEYLNSREYGSKSKDSLISILSSAENTYRSITAVFGSKMSIFDDINVANVTSSSDFDFDILGRVPTTLYVIVPDEDKTYYTLITILVGMMYKELVKLANSQENKRLPYEIDFILDEFANCPPLSNIESIVSVARSRGMHFHFFIQSFSQLENVYGKNVAQIILDNCGLIYLKTNTQETAEAISKRLGKKTIESNSIRQSMSLNNYNGDKSINLIGRDLLTPEEVKQLHYKTIIFPVVGFPIFRDTIIYKKFSNYKPGELCRKNRPLLNLQSTFYTVEMIKSGHMDKNRVLEKEEFYTELKNQDISKLEKITPIIENIFLEDCSFNYLETEGNRTYLQIKINHKLTNREKLLIKRRINFDYFHLEIIEKATNDEINIYLKNI